MKAGIDMGGRETGMEAGIDMKTETGMTAERAMDRGKSMTAEISHDGDATLTNGFLTSCAAITAAI